MDQYDRTRLLLGKEAIEKLKNSRVAVFGLGGVGGHCVEALARAGVGTLDIVDNDKVSLTNINRQLIATHSTVGQYKTDVMAARIADIDPEIKVNSYRCFFLPEERDRFPFADYDYIVDCIDTVTAKIDLVMAANEHQVPVISAMGAGNKLDPTRFEVADIYETSICPLAKVMRRELKKRGITKLKCVYSRETAIIPDAEEVTGLDVADAGNKRAVPGSVPFVPPVVGLIIAGEVIKDISGKITV